MIKRYQVYALIEEGTETLINTDNPSTAVKCY